MDEQSKQWYNEIKETERKDPDPEKRECCKTVLFGDLATLDADVHNVFWNGTYRLKVNFCPHCGKSIKEIRDIVIQEMKDNFGTPANFLKEQGKVFLDGKIIPDA